VRNYQARNLLRDELKKGDGVLFYHSNAKPPAVAGTAKVVREGYPDHTALDPDEKYFDPKSDPEKPTWFMVDIQFERAFEEPRSLPMLREVPALADMVLLRRGMRLSVQAVTRKEWQTILKMGP
jgi:predicted RNA-binding protein with PUA-like domain